MNRTCEEISCQTEAERIKRDYQGNPHWYCSTHYAQEGLKLKEEATKSVPMVKSSSEARGAISRVTSSHVHLIEKEKKEIGSITMKLQKPDIGLIQRENERDIEESVKPHFSAQELETIDFDTPLTPRRESKSYPKNLEEAKSQSMNLIDDSVESMHELMISVRDNIKQKNKTAEYKHVDPAQVNAAVNCAREIANLLKVKLQIHKEMK